MAVEPTYEELKKRVQTLEQAEFERNKAVQALRESEAKMKSIFRAAPIGIGVVSNRVFLEINERLCQITGYSRDELLGQDSRLIYPTDEEYEYVGTEKYRQIEAHGTGTVETRFQRKDGKIINVLMSSTPLDPANLEAGVTFTALDITKRIKSEQNLIQSETKYRRLFERSTDAIFIVEKSTGRYLDANVAAARLTGHTPEEIKNLTTSQVTPDYAPTRLEALDSSNGAIDMGEVTYVRPDGSRRIAKLTTVPLDDRSVFGIAQDMTEHIRTEEARQKAESAREQLEKQVQQAQKMESIGNLAGGIAHDFNNILFPIIGMSELLLEDLPPNTLVHENVQEILKAGKRGRDLVKQILAFSRQAEHKMMPVRIQQVLTDVLNLSRSTIPTNIDITQEIQDDCGLVMADLTQIHQIAMNLITNAYHALEQDDGQISVTLREIDIEPQDIEDSDLAPGRYAMFSVSDTGCGIDQAIVEKIFDPYFTTKAPDKGTGLGLAVVYGIVKGHQGAIKMYSEKGNGSTFRVYLPLMKRAHESATTAPENAYPCGTERILLIDDEAPIVEIEKQMLERLGYKATARVNSLEALEAFKANPQAFDLVITDMTMPHMTGDQLAKAVISIKPDMPVIICTGFSERINQENSAANGIRGFLMKPIIRSELAQMVRRVLDNS